MKKTNKKSWGGVCKKVAFLCVIFMLLNVSMAGTFLSVHAVIAPPIDEDEQLCEAAVDIVLIMDRSGSMGWENPTRLSQAKNAANVFLSNLDVDDQSALVSYASEAVLDEELSNNHSVTQTAVNSLMARGGTNIGDAIYLSNGELGSARTNPQAVKAAILLTDGRPTCPYYDSSRYSMCGFIEDDEDVAYTLDAANAAAALGYKIFTIGLGRENKINEEMLREIADTTGAEYYYAPSSGDLEGIYESIRWQLCEYGSVSGCKYETDNEGNNEASISGWEINLSGDNEITQLTDENGCYKFSGLLSGSYTVSEGGKDGIMDFVQTYPNDPSLSYSITLGSEESLTGYDFGNYFPVCGNNILDEDFGESCDDGNTEDGDGCSSECLPENNFICGNGIKEGNEECDGSDGVFDYQVCSESCELIDLTYCGDEIQQTPNDEGTGGPLNDGNEECDGVDGIGANQTCSDSCVLLESLCRIKLDTVVIMDRSGSMGWENPTRLAQAKIAANSFVGKLGLDDRSALVSFSTTANLDKHFSNDHSATQTMVNDLIASGATNIGDAIALANDEFLNNGNDEALKMEILLTDGVANKPNGDGFEENPDDVAYAEAKAAEAALMGIKIFTIGLGNEINETMLQNIADTTGAVYYNAPTADDLDGIFSDIAYDICKYGSISGCKYEDSNNDGDIFSESTLSDWEINLSGDANSTQLTDENGCYIFGGLLGGNYTVSEGGKDGVDNFVQTYPQDSLFYNIILGAEEEATGYDFGNYLPVCGNDILDTGEECDDGNNIDGDNCSASCDIEGGGGYDPVCGNDILDTGEQCDDGNTDDGDGCSSICELEENSHINANDIVVNEIMYDSSAVNDTYGEWFEVYNTTDSGIELEGCIISDDGSNSHTIGESLIVPANGYAVLAKNADSLSNGGIIPDYVYASFSLTNTADQIILTCESVEIDRVDYGRDGWPTGTGASIILNDPGNDNNDFANWCVSTTPYGDGDLGTPGNQNDSCEDGQCADSDGDGVCDDADNCPNDSNPDQADADDNGIGDACEIPDPVCVDNDGDGYGTGDTTNCLYPEVDCNDDNGSAYPGATEVCDDGVDNDCDTMIDCDDCDCDSDSACDSGNDSVMPDVIINEVAWMGTDVSTDDEWIELRNMTDEEIFLDDWTLNAQDGSPSIILENSISANGYYLLERSNDDTVASVSADKIYTGALGNAGEFLELRKADNSLVDEVDGSVSWPAGSAEPKHPMERCADDNWYDSDVAGGTPKAENGCSGVCADSDGDGICDDTDNCPDISNPGQEDADDNGTGDACEIPDPVCVDNDSDGYGTGDTTNCPNQGIDCDDTDANINPGVTEVCDDGVDNNCDGQVDEGCDVVDSINIGDVVVNEIMYDPDAVDDAVGEWFELFNTTVAEINLEGCIISDNGSNSHIISASLVIPAGGYAVLGRNNDLLVNGEVVVNYTYSDFILGNTEDEIILTCDSIEIDRVDYRRDGWPTGTGASIILNDPANDNNEFANWGVSTSFYYLKEDGDLGTPGNQNDSF